MPHRFQCRCGTLQGEIDEPMRSVRAVCYCGDCQAYAHLLGQAPRILDDLGGTDIVATQARYVRFTSGSQALACLSLSPRGLLRWYAKCCNTPIANTPRTWKLPYAGLVHACLRQPETMERSFPEVQLHINTKHAKGEPPKSRAIRGMARFAGLMFRLAGSRLAGGYRATPFFNAKGVPVAEVVVAQREAVEQARRL
ncbi:MAG: hypothetical protein JWQ76_2262 [Ramlibacter sp.]|nr:hypothetical protein [Ramlibacter sp.]